MDQCYYDSPVCSYTQGVWKCQSCGETFCVMQHFHDNDLGECVECVACESKRLEAAKPEGFIPCYYDNDECDYLKGMWQCLACKTWFCREHRYGTVLGECVECPNCQIARITTSRTLRDRYG